MAISFVLIAEMINSALEAGIDVATTSFDPLAKLAKDIAAGAVLIATVNAVAVGYLVFVDRIKDPSSRAIDRLRDAPTEITLVALVLTVDPRDRREGLHRSWAAACAAACRRATRRSPSRGGWPRPTSSATRRTGS